MARVEVGSLHHAQWLAHVQQADEPRAQAGQKASLAPYAWWLGISIVVVLAGILGPWARQGLFTFNGIDTDDGKVAMALWVVTALLAVIGVWQRSTTTAGMVGIAGVGLTALGAAEVATLADDTTAVGWGVWVIAIAGASCTVAAFSYLVALALRTNPRKAATHLLYGAWVLWPLAIPAFLLGLAVSGRGQRRAGYTISGLAFLFLAFGATMIGVAAAGQ